MQYREGDAGLNKDKRRTSSRRVIGVKVVKMQEFAMVCNWFTEAS